jgi:hypothetical protein
MHAYTETLNACTDPMTALDRRENAYFQREYGKTMENFHVSKQETASMHHG